MRTVDFNDLMVRVNGIEMFRGKLSPSLLTVLESYQRRRDWGMLYSARLSFEDKNNTWIQKDQLQLKV